ncbi:hypothetical protein NDU88_004814 [Pleurodeles waltl]|uniref:Uncharacterized protein n=1 Tax=Pleurodeles waltl TaxID=8319 RepID=A0AAV7VKX2_PLEWA|nr:hypothetical protein NDU88_004814 [Pleurodeles waltl]
MGCNEQWVSALVLHMDMSPIHVVTIGTEPLNHDANSSAIRARRLKVSSRARGRRIAWGAPRNLAGAPTLPEYGMSSRGLITSPEVAGPRPSACPREPWEAAAAARPGALRSGGTRRQQLLAGGAGRPYEPGN